MTDTDLVLTPASSGGRDRVRYRKRGQVAYLTLNRPHVLDAMDPATHAELGRLPTGRPLTAERAYQRGLINDVDEPEQPDACVEGLIRDLLVCAPLAVAVVREAAERSVSMPLEGLLAFVENRPPDWQGR